jgi:hypothetical protein
MNENQKKILLATLALFFASVIYVPNAQIYPSGLLVSRGWEFIWDLRQLDIKILIIEWAALAFLGGGFFLYFKHSQ